MRRVTNETECLRMDSCQEMPRKGRVTLYGPTRDDTTRQNILLWFSHARIHTSSSPTSKDADSVVGTERREYFACVLTDGRREGTLVFALCRVVPCRIMLIDPKRETSKESTKGIVS
jgi:hypothetical protein